MIKKLILVCLLSLLAIDVASAAKGIYANINLDGEKATLQANGNSELLISQKDGTQNGMWIIDGTPYVGFKQPGNAWIVFDPARMGKGFSPPPKPETKVEIMKTNQEIDVAGIAGRKYNVTSEEEGNLEKGYMIASKEKLVRQFNERLFNLISAA